MVFAIKLVNAYLLAEVTVSGCDARATTAATSTTTTTAWPALGACLLHHRVRHE
jgi:hypothetical protein